MEIRQRLLYPLVLLLSSCSIFDQFEDTYDQRFSANDVVKISQLQSKDLVSVKAPTIRPVVAVYPSSFTDQTGQRKSNSSFALFLRLLRNNLARC